MKSTISLGKVSLLIWTIISVCLFDISSASGDVAYHGKVYTRSFSSYPVNRYLVYVPNSYDGKTSWPMVVAVHGCNTSADQMMESSLMNQEADNGHFIVLYPENAGGIHCWHALWSWSGSLHRGTGGEADQIANVTQSVMQQFNIDSERVFIMGMSSGGFQTTATIAAYPELYAAAGVNAGGPYDSFGCELAFDQQSPSYALKALIEMGERKRIIPFISFGGTSDSLNLGENPRVGGCARKAFYAAMIQNNIIHALHARDGLSLPKLQDGLLKSFYQADQQERSGLVPGGYSWHQKIWRDPNQCEIGEEWIVDGMGHFWSGGSNDPTYSQFTDPKGPNASHAAWVFFSKFKKSTTANLNCD